MARRPAPHFKDPSEVLSDLFTNHEEAARSGPAQARKYLDNLLARSNSIPNAVKFFIHDLLAEACYGVGDAPACLAAAEAASGYMETAREEAARAFEQYKPRLRFLERGISVCVDQGEFEKALKFCDMALALDLGSFYEAKRRSILKMT